MKSQKVFGVVAILSLLGNTVQAAPPTTVQEAIDQIQADSILLSQWLSDQFKRAVPFNSTAGNVVPSQLKIFGFEVGVMGVVSGTQVDKDGFHNLGTTVVNTREIDMFDRMPFPMVLGHAKIGLPFGLDAGVRIGGIPSTDSDEGDTHVEVSNTVFGLDLRKKLIEEGVAKPFGLTVGVNYTRAEGHISATTPYKPTISSDVDLSVDALGAVRTEWETQSIGAQVLLNKKILFINPYLGVSVNKNFGDIDSTITNTGAVTEVNGVPVAPQSYSTIGGASAKADEVDLRGLVGLEFTILPFMKLGIGGEVASQSNLAGHLGLRVQFR